MSTTMTRGAPARATMNTTAGASKGERRPALVDRIADFDCELNDVILVPKEDGFITAGDDKTVRVWLKRDSGKYWPSVCYYADSKVTTLFYHPEPRRLFAGLDSGNILEFAVGEDYNKVILIRQYLAHRARITALYYSLEHDWVLSCSRDKYFNFHSTDSARRIGSFLTDSFTTCVTYDMKSRQCFVGDAAGNISWLKLSDSGVEFKATFAGHMDQVTSLAWDAARNHLFSSSYDKTIVCWTSIGGQKVVTYELEGHLARVSSLYFSALKQQLLSGSQDARLLVWDMDVTRKESPDWRESDVCEKCKEPFFWNFGEMWSRKTIGKRQHHCRSCGLAMCDECCSQFTTIPVLGHELKVRVCKECNEKLDREDASRTPLACVYETSQRVTRLSVDEARRYMLTFGEDNSVKIWDISSIL